MDMLKSSFDAVVHPVTMLLKHKDGPGAAAPLTVKVVVTLSGRGPESVTLTVETQGPMTLVWPAFGGLFAGKAVGLTKIERVSPAAAAGSAAQAPNMLGSLRKRLGRSGHWQRTTSVGRYGSMLAHNYPRYFCMPGMQFLM